MLLARFREVQHLAARAPALRADDHLWREHRAIGLRTKIVATLMVAASTTWSVLKLDAPWNVVALLIGAAVLTFLLSRRTAGAHLQGGRIEDR